MVKELLESGERLTDVGTQVGNGIVDMKSVIPAAVAAGARWLIVEQDVCKRPALESAKISIETVRKFLA